MAGTKTKITPNQVKGFFQQIAEHVLNEGGSAELAFSPDDSKLVATLSKTSKKIDTSDILSKIFAQSAKEVLEAACQVEISHSKTIQRVPSVHLRPDIGCFVQFSGDYTGLLIMNFSGNAAMNLYRGSMLFMGLPEEDLSVDYTADDVVNTIGELINQVIGNFRNRIDQKFGLVANNTQPKAISINASVTLSIETNPMVTDLYRRVSLKADGAPFQIEVAMENTQFNKLEDWRMKKEEHTRQIEMP